MTQPHTPGPWEIQEPLDNEIWIVEAGKESYEWRVIAALPWPDERGDISKTQVRANAGLIAAGTELLEAAREGLRSMEQHLTEILTSHCLLDEELKPRRDTLDQCCVAEVVAKEQRIAMVRAAIAKATGGAA